MCIRDSRVHHDGDKAAVAGTVKGQEVKGIGSAAKHALTGAVCRVGFIRYLVEDVYKRQVSACLRPAP